MLRKIECIVQPFKFEEVKKALNEIAVEGMTVTEVKGCGKQKGHKQEYQQGPITLRQKIKLEIVTREEEVDEIIKIIQKYARTGEIGDGKIFVYPIEEAIRIRTKERGGSAIR